MKLILIRHGETEWVKAGRYQGSTDVPLNALGRRQARAAAREIRGHNPFLVYSSELSRVRETAKYIARSCRKEIVIDPRLNEVSFGRWEGHSFESVRRRYPKDVRQWYEARWSSRPTGGESLESLAKRVLSFFDELADRHAGNSGACVVVTHGGPIRVMLMRVFGVSPRFFWNVRIDPASVSAVEISKQKRELVLLNSSAHLNGLVKGGHTG
jgi:alpha-ribazole phosphatase